MFPLQSLYVCPKHHNVATPGNPGELLIALQMCFGFQTCFCFKFYFSPFPKKIKLPVMLLPITARTVQPFCALQLDQS